MLTIGYNYCNDVSSRSVKNRAHKYICKKSQRKNECIACKLLLRDILLKIQLHSGS